MAEYGGERYPTVCPYLYYRDADAALEFLATAFGFKERMRTTDDSGHVRHAELDVGDSVIMLGGTKDASGQGCSGGVYVHVDDVEAHFAQAKAAGAQVQEAPTDQAYGVRSYGALDTEGHQWWFSQPLA